MTGRPLKILHVASHNEIRAGGSIQMMRLALGLRELGHDVHCAFNIRRSDETPGLGTFGPLQDADIPIISFPMQRIWKYPAMWRFKKFVVEQKFDVIHCHRFRALNFVCKATRDLQIPALLGDKKNSFDIPESWAKLYGSPQVDCIVVNAQLIKKMFADTGLVAPGKVEIIYNGVDLDRFHPGVDGNGVRQEFGIGPTTPVLGMIANFAGKKSHDILFQAAVKVLEKFPQARFLLVGGGDSQRYQKELTRHGYGSNFIFTGFRSDIPRIVAALDVSVISSKRGEGLTGSIVEAMAMAKPVVSTAVAGNPEFVHGQETGMLAEPGSVQSMADAMLYLLEHPDEARAMGRRGFTFAKDKIDNRRRSQRFEDLYRSIMQRKGIQ
jgi:glycosyltransferase involved in cell wall biosynthesis